MRMKLLPILLGVCLVPVAAHSEDLLDAFHQAITNDPVLATANANLIVAAEGVPQARSALLPQLSVGLGLEQFHGGGDSSTTDSNGNIVDTGAGGHVRERDLSANLNQPIINLASIATLRAATSVRSFNVLVAEDNLAVDQSYEDAYKQEFDQSSERFKDGLAMASDVTQSQAYYLFIKSQRLGALDVLKDSKRALEQITGQPTLELKKLRDDLPMQLPQPADPKAWVDAAMQTNPTILSARYSVSADEHRISAARAGHLPTLNLSLGYSKFGNWSNALPGSSAYGTGTTTVGLVLNVPIFTGGLTQSQVRQAIGQRDADEGVLETQRRQAARDANNFYNQILDGVEQVGSARTSVDAAKKSLASMRAGYEIGTQNLTNVVVAIQVLAEAQSEYTLVRHQFVLNKLLLKQAAGTIDVHDLEDVNRLLE
jgi:outer membrane protein